MSEVKRRIRDVWARNPKESQIIVRASEAEIQAFKDAAREWAISVGRKDPDRALSAWVRRVLTDAAMKSGGSK